MKVVIVGCGRIGASLARLLHTDGYDVCVVDKEERSFARLGKAEAIKRVLGVGIDLDVLKEAGIETADAFAAVTNGDNTNYMSARIAKEMFGVRTVVARLIDPNRSTLMRNAGIAMMSPTVLGARALGEMITRGAVATHLMIGGKLMVEEIVLGINDEGKSVAEVGEEQVGKIIAIIRGQEFLTTQEGDPVIAGDIVLCARSSSSDIH